MMTSLVILCPMDLVPAANQLGQALGWGGDNYHIQLSADQDGLPAWPPTHRASRANAERATIEAAIAAIDAGQYGPQVKALVSTLIIDMRDDMHGLEHLNAVAHAANLRVL